MKKAVIIAIASRKGGVAKTTTVAALGSYFAKQGLKTLLVDVDSQANLTSTFLTAPPEETVTRIFSGKCIPLYEIRECLTLAPADEDLAAVEGGLKWASQREILKKVLDSLREYYDIILIDCPPSLSWLMINALSACDYLFVPVEADQKAIDAISLIGEACEQSATPTQIDGLFFTRFEPRLKASKEAAGLLTLAYGGKVMATKIRKCSKVPESSLCRTDIISFSPGCNASLDYANLAREISSKVGLPLEEPQNVLTVNQRY